MPTKQVSFYATKNDLAIVLETAVSKVPFYFATIDEDKEMPPVIYNTTSNILDLGVAINGDQNHEKKYLLIAPNIKPKVRFIKQQRGGYKQFFDQKSHPQSVVLWPGGVLRDYECIVAGQIGTISNDKWSVNLYKALSLELKKRFIKVKAYYVGDEAMKKLETGARLTTSNRLPEEFGLKL